MGREPDIYVRTLDRSADVLYDSRTISWYNHFCPQRKHGSIGGNRPFCCYPAGSRYTNLLRRTFHLPVVVDRAAEEEPFLSPPAALTAITVSGYPQYPRLALGVSRLDTYRIRRRTPSARHIRRYGNSGNSHKHSNRRQSSCRHKPHANTVLVISPVLP